MSKVVLGVVLAGMVVAVGLALWTQRQNASATVEAAAVAECQSVREAAARERRPDGSLPNDNRSLQIELDVCEQEGQ